MLFVAFVVVFLMSLLSFLDTIVSILKIASLKSALARKGTDHQNTLPSPDPIHIATPSPVHPRRQSSGAYLSSQTTHRQPMEEVRNIEVSVLL